MREVSCDRMREDGDLDQRIRYLVGTGWRRRQFDPLLYDYAP